MSNQTASVDQPVDPSSPLAAGGVRRHHTITSTSRAARANAREVIDESGQSPSDEHWQDDEVVDEDWVGGVGAVGEKSGGLHRQSSLPTRYHRDFRGTAKKTGTMTPQTLNSLTAITGHEGDEEDWERDMRGLRNEAEDELPSPDASQNSHLLEPQLQGTGTSPLSTHFTPPTNATSPPTATSGVRRHQSLTYGATGGVRRLQTNTGLKRSGTLQGNNKASHSQAQSTGTESPSPPDEEEYVDEGSYGYEDDYYVPSPLQQQQQYPASPMGRASPWNNNGASRNNVGGIDDVQRALSALEISSGMQGGQMYNQQNYPAGQSAHPPRFNPNYPPPPQAPGIRHSTSNSNMSASSGGSGASAGQKLQLVTNFDGRKTPQGQQMQSAPGMYGYGPGVPQGQQGYGPGQQQQQPQFQNHGNHQRGVTDSGVSHHQGQLERKVLGGRSSNPNLQYGYQQGAGNGGQGIPNVPAIPQQFLQPQGPSGGGPRLGAGQPGANPPGFANTPIDVPSLIAAKGYNPTNFDVRPQFARFFVIKSYTEDDVHKSLKYEIWSSTDPGNKRLDKAFKETASRGPIYLFFSVNASGHFCGMAEMLTPVDYTRSSTVWASDKWKGVFKVRWIFVRDIPNVNLRHIKLNNTQERKPVTNSRDTQELLPDAGQEMLRIFHTHPARTSLLQDFAFYELQAMQKLQPGVGTSGPSSPAQSPPQSFQTPAQLQPLSPSAQLNQIPFGALGGGNGGPSNMPMPYGMSSGGQMGMGVGNGGQMGGMVGQMNQMGQMGMGGGGPGPGQQQPYMGGPRGGLAAQQMHQSVMRHPSPGPPAQGYMGR